MEKEKILGPVAERRRHASELDFGAFHNEGLHVLQEASRSGILLTKRLTQEERIALSVLLTQVEQWQESVDQKKGRLKRNNDHS